MNLLDTIYEVPQLLHVTNSNSRKALQATCRQLRHLVYTTASVVSFGTDGQTLEADARLLASGTWMHLKAMNFSNAGMNANAIAVLSQGDWLLLEILVLSNNQFGAPGMEHVSQGSIGNFGAWLRWHVHVHDAIPAACRASMLVVTSVRE